MKRVLGIDLSLNSTGLCLGPVDGVPTLPALIDASRATTLKNDYLFMLVNFPKPTKKNPGPSREEKWHTIKCCVLYLAQKANVVVMEEYAFGAQGRSKSILCEIGGIVRYALYSHGHKYQLVTPTTLKKFATGAANVSKSMIPKEVYKRWKIDLDSDDLADALVLTKIGQAIAGENFDVLTEFQKEALKNGGLLGDGRQ